MSLFPGLTRSVQLSVAIMTFMTVIQSCKQDEVSPIRDPSTNIKIEKLKVFLSDLNNVDVSTVKYDDATKMFSIEGVNHLDIASIQALYTKQPTVNYKNGAPVSK